MIKLQDEQFYSDDFDKESYRDAQIRRHKAKANKRREINHYLRCAEEFINIIPVNANMICMGTRNNHERDVLKEGLSSKGINVYSLDISPLSGADYVMDFNDIPRDWQEKWDVVFSNAIDHSVDATKTFFDWLQMTKKGGVIIVGFDKNIKPEGVEKRDIVGEADCCSFKLKNVDVFMRSSNNDFEFISCFDNSYVYYVLRKK